MDTEIDQSAIEIPQFASIMLTETEDDENENRRGRRKDWIWKFFDNVTTVKGVKAKCKLCSKQMLSRCYTLKNHLRNRHQEFQEVYESLSAESKNPNEEDLLPIPKDESVNTMDNDDLTEYAEVGDETLHQETHEEEEAEQKLSENERSGNSTMCLFCQTRINYTSRTSLVSPAWSQSCAESICELFQLDTTFHSYFTSDKFCESCLTHVLNIDFNLKTLAKLNSSLAKSRRTLEDLLKENVERVSSVRLPRALKTYSQTVMTVFNAVHPHEYDLMDFVKPEVCKNSSEAIRHCKSEKQTRVSRYGRKVSYINLKSDMDVSSDEDVKPMSQSTESDTQDFDYGVSEIQDSDKDMISDRDYNAPSKRPVVKKVVKKRIPKKQVLKATAKQKRISCSVPGCNHSFLEQRCLDVHVRSVHEGDKTPYHCDQCSLKFEDSTCYDEHYKSHIQKRSYNCIVCKTVFSKKWSLKNHLVSSQECILQLNASIVPEPKKCSYCSKLCAQEELEGHEALHEAMDATTLPFACVLCEQQFTNTVDLRNHVLLEHETSLPRCDQCSKAFNSLPNLRRHMEIMHSDRSASLQCKQCSYIGVNKSDYIRHLRTHRTGRDYQCEQCGNTYKSNSNLKLHMMIHNNVTPFRCRLCPKAFNQSCKLKAHEQTHAPTKTYVCDKCGKSFRTEKNIYQHKTYYCKDGPKLPYSRSVKRKERERNSQALRDPEDFPSQSVTAANSKERSPIQPEYQDANNPQFYPIQLHDSFPKKGHYASILQTSIAEPVLHTMLGSWVNSQSSVIQVQVEENLSEEFETSE